MNISSLQFGWHIHHNILVEPLSDALEVRRDYIRQYKNPAEVPLRLQLMRLVTGELPPPVIKAGANHDKAWRTYDKARGAKCEKALENYYKALENYNKAMADNLPAIMALHTAECEPDCPWDGKTIFP